MKTRSNQSAGYTLVEMIVVVVVIGILAAMAGPSLLGWLTRQRVNSAQAEALTALREAQSNAKREKRVWAACFHDDGNKVRWAVSPAPTDSWTCRDVIAGRWKNMVDGDANKITIDTANSNFNQSPSGYYMMQFQYKGLVNDNAAGKLLTFVPRNQPTGTKRCVFVSTILGAMRAGAGNDECRPL